ncbi:MAG: hypothetical protein QOE06_3513 [Thermoleophilaceae bacterium]|jgi:hypothetical protein|nr:hypothetical protein [Thermoleophilaceae bacterium]
MSSESSNNGKRSDGKVIDAANIVVGGITDGDIKVVLDRALKRESEYFRLTEGQRKALGVKRSR